DEGANLAPARSVRPPARPLVPSAVTPAPDPEPSPQAERNNPINNALAEALAGTDTPTPEPTGPPLSQGEKDALRVSVSRCWNVGSLSTAALAVTVVVGVSMTPEGKPEASTIRLLSSSGGDGGAAKQAFDAARRAIIRCGSSGFDLPSEKYGHWRDIEMTFNPERMRNK
ncbi:MAG: energy transducer TonB, partial [Rhodobacteraceae bacterium]|nr:energy transducer TonB [Paracoccaceae bacterium]